MASRYMLIEFDDEASATKLKSQIDSATHAGKKFRVVGLFAKPQAPYCRCGKETTTKTQTTSLKRGKRFGWWVCTECKRPAASISGLVNLLTKSDIIRPSTFESDHQGLGKHTMAFFFYSISATHQAVPKE